MEKFDFKKAFKHLFSASAKKPSIVEVPECQYIMIDGAGHPQGNSAFEKAMQTVYSIMYTLKMGWKFEKYERPYGYVDFTVPPPEALWWMADGSQMDLLRKSEWRWTLLMMLPDFFTKKMLDDGAEAVREKKGADAIAPYRFERWEEGTCVQMMHVGPYAAEEVTLEKMDSLTTAEGFKMEGKHHEIYLSDPGRTAPEKLKTILRQPVS